MAGIVHGYEYDIFISYRQKDNKGDRWVSEFVDNLKGELESTFKEEINVYFDINPHDGLLETHDVDESLKDKLNCLIFIPIISRTYCDPKSFAWEHEFKAFVERASQDQFGLKVKLTNGNVASRVLPIRIHDLDNEDIKLCESVLGGLLRGVDFIYKSAGINRPLRSKEEKPKENINNTIYRDQINKVANSIKEIIQGLTSAPVQNVKDKDQLSGSFIEARRYGERIYLGKPAKSNRYKFLSSAAIVAILIIGLILAYSKIFKRKTLDQLRSTDMRITVAVMPFQNMTNDTMWNIWQNGIQNELIINLTNSKELKVRQIGSIMGLIQSEGITSYASITPSFASAISQKLDANVFICGSIKQAGYTLRVSAQIINSKTEDTFKSFQVDGTAGNILHIIDSLSQMLKNFLIISKLEKDVTPDLKIFASTDSPEAYRYFIEGDKAYWERDYSTAIKLYSRAAAIDSNFTISTLMLSVAYGDQGLYPSARKWCLKAYSKKDQLPIQQKILTNWIYAQYFETPFEKIKYINQLLEIDDQLPLLYYQLGLIYNELNQYAKAIPEGERTLEIYNKWDTKPKLVNIFTMLGKAYHETKQYKKEKILYKNAEQYFTNNPEILRRQIILLLSEGDTAEANKYISNYQYTLIGNSVPQSDIMTGIASAYYEAGILDKAVELYREVLSLYPQKPAIMNNLAWILIDNDLNINEGMKLIDKALRINPESYNFIDTKGWGLYKQGNYKEALALFEKSWELKPVYNHVIFLHLEEAKKAVAGQK